MHREFGAPLGLASCLSSSYLAIQAIILGAPRVGMDNVTRPYGAQIALCVPLAMYALLPPDEPSTPDMVLGEHLPGLG